MEAAGHHRFRVFLAVLVCATAALLSACAAGDDVDMEVLVVVEDGVTVVYNPGLHIADSLAWSVDTAASVRVGVVEGEPEYMIGQLAGMLRRRDGTILIADAIAHDVRVFDEQGRFVRRVGRKGEGPGEFAWMSGLFTYGGDTIVVADGEGSRLNILDGDLNFVRRERPRLQESVARGNLTSHRVRGFFSDGSLLMSDYLNVCATQRREGGFCVDSSAFYRTSGTGPARAGFGRLVTSRNEMIRLRPGFSTGWHEPHPQAFVAVHGDRFYYADAERFEVRVFRGDTLERVIRVAAEPPRFSHDDVFHMPAPPAGTAEDPRQREARIARASAVAGAKVPDPLPHFSEMVVDETGHIWLREYMPALKPDGPRPRWFVVDLEGRLRYSLRWPTHNVRRPGFVAALGPQIGDDFILDYRRDAFGVETVVLHALHKRP